MLSGHKLSRITAAAFLCLYLFFPSGLSTTDSWYYAASIKYCSEIFHPHHLLYNALGLVFSWLPVKFGFDILSSMKVMNACFAFLALIIIQQILYIFRISEKHVFLISCLIGFSFSMLRYATENETYIVPLFFALLASFNYAKFITSRNNRFAVYAGLCAALSLLFHQTYIFWWIGLLTGFLIEKRKKPALLYILVSLIAPIVYLIVILTYKGGLSWSTILSFILGDFNGNAMLGLSWKGICLSIINLIRSFIQVHGYIYNLIRGNLLLAIPGIVSISLILLAFLKPPESNKTNISQRFSKVHIFLIVLQFIFAIFSFGNTEFMVMIPALIFMLIPFFAFNYERFILLIMIAMAVWNISYGLIPLHYKSQAQEQFLCDAALSEKNIIIIASDDQLIKNMLYYKTGNNTIKSVFKSPASMKIKGSNPEILEGVIDSALRSGIEIFTNCLDKQAISRQSIIEGDQNRDFFRKYETILAKSWKLSTGTKSIYKIERKF